MKIYVLVACTKRIKPKSKSRFIYSWITRIETYDLAEAITETSLLVRHAIDKYKSLLGDNWLVIASEVDHEEASEILANMEVDCD